MYGAWIRMWIHARWMCMLAALENPFLPNGEADMIRTVRGAGYALDYLD